MTMPDLPVTVFLEPISPHYENDRLFEQHPYGDFHAPFLRVREAFAERGIDVHTADRLPDLRESRSRNLYFAIGNVRNYERVAARRDTILSGLFHIEAPIVHPTTYRETPRASRVFRRVYSFSTPEALAPFGCGDVALRKYLIPQPYDHIFENLWGRRDRRFVAMVSQNKLPNLDYNELYTERLRLLAYFNTSSSVDLYGIGWDKMPFRVGERRLPPQLVRIQRFVWERLPFTRNHPAEDLIKQIWRGTVESKHETLSRYTFAFTYENMVLDGWVNEKLFDALLVGTIPIYLGAPDVHDYVPEDCFIDPRRFATYAELESYMCSLGPKEIEAYREAGRAFVASEGFRAFTPQAFAEILLQAAEEDLAAAA